MRGRAPLVSLAVAGASLLALGAPELLELSREGLGRGDLWRLFTGHLAHFSLYHWAVDAGTLVALGWLYEDRIGRARWGALLAGSALSVSGAFLVLETDLGSYRGLSGLDCAAFAAALVSEARRRPALAGAVGLLFAAKIAFEQATGGFLFPSAGLGDMGLPVLSAHSVGALAGLASGLGVRDAVASPAPACRHP